MHVRFLLLLFQCCITLAYQAGSVFAKPNIESSQLQCRRMKSNEAVEDHLSSDIFRPSDEILCVIEVAGADGEQILGTTQELFNMFDVTVTYMSTQNSIPVRPEGKPSTEMHQNVTFFSFVPQIPGQVRVFVTEKETGRTIAKGTFILDVYTRPVHMDPFICRNSIIALRSKTLCTAIAHAENKTDLVYVAEEDIFIEVHPPKALKVRLIPGLSRVQLQLEAPIEMPVKDKIVVVNVVSEYGHNTSSEKMYRTIQLELMYPKLSATDHSILTCDSFSNVCTVATRDDIGPVFVDTSTLGIAFDPASASVMKAQWVPGADEAHAQLHYRSTMEHRVIRGMLSVFIDATVSHIMGSPVNYIYGIPPTAHTARIQGCSTVQSLIPGGTQGCRIRVLSNVTADVEYVTVSATEGIISMAPTFYKDEYEQGWHFEYTAPTLAEFGNRTYSEVEVHVTIDGNEVDGAPIHFLISNRNSLIDEVELKKHRKIVVFIGTAVFSAMIAGSLVAVLFKQAAREKTS